MTSDHPYSDRFTALCAEQGWQADQFQRDLAAQFDRLWGDIMASRGLLGRKAVIGLYIYGGVGRGKTVMMDLLYDAIPVKNARKSRAHFNAFMLDVHARLHQMDGVRDPLTRVADEIADTLDLLCFDEFQVTDIADAMILKTLFDRLFEKKVILVATSNVAPDDLYHDGLQRQKFLPFIDVLKHHCHIHRMDSPTDYRLMSEQGAQSHYITPHSTPALQACWDRFSGNAPCHDTQMHVDGRVLTLKCAHERVGWVSFSELCEKPRGAKDYLALAEHYDTLIIEHIPRLGYDRRNEAKRLILLIDTLYEAGVLCVFSAEAEIVKLYQGNDHGFEFERTISRLIEMQSPDWPTGSGQSAKAGV